MEDSIAQFLALVQPDSLGDFFIYGIFIMAFIILLPMPDGNDSGQYLTFGVMLLCVLDLLRQSDGFPIPGSENFGFFTFFIHVLMFVFSFITAGVVRSNTKQKAGPVPMLAVLNGLIALLYTIIAYATQGGIYS